MRQWLIDFLKELERLIPPPEGGHHALTYAQYGSDDEDWTDQLKLTVFDGGVFRPFFLDEEDLNRTPKVVATDVLGLVCDERLKTLIAGSGSCLS